MSLDEKQPHPKDISINSHVLFPERKNLLKDFGINEFGRGGSNKKRRPKRRAGQTV